MSSIAYDPPEDGLWGALEASGNMSGLIGQAAYNEVDMSLSGIMITRYIGSSDIMKSDFFIQRPVDSC